MAHFAELDQQNRVLQVIVVNNDVLLDENGNESEDLGVAFCQSLYGEDTNWKQTSFNRNFRNKYAGVGDYYDPYRDAFLKLQPFPSWTLNENTLEWYAPVPHPMRDDPADTNTYSWNELEQQWDLVE